MIALALAGLVIAAAVAIAVLARVLRRDGDKGIEAAIIAVCLGVLIWGSPTTRSLIVGIAAVVIAGSFGPAGMLTAAGLVALVAYVVPGGVSVVLLAILALVGVGQIRAARRHLQRLSRAATLVANEPVEHEVELTGRARAVTPIVDPIHGRPCAMWRLVAGGATRESAALVEIRGATGSAIIDPASVKIEWSRGPEVVAKEQADAALAELRLEAKDAAISLYVLPDDTACYVIGMPAWEIAPANTVGMYRDAPILPTFRATPEHPVFFADRSETQLRGDYRWAVVVWGVWGAVCAAIAICQVGGWA